MLTWPKPPFSLGVFFHARCEKWESTLTAITSAPMSILWIDPTFEVVCSFAVADDFGGADVGEVEWIEKKHNIFSRVVGESDIGEGVVW